jgi:hypothetical protein
MREDWNYLQDEYRRYYGLAQDDQNCRPLLQNSYENSDHSDEEIELQIRRPYGKIQNTTETSRCSICIEEFSEDTEVAILLCSKDHIYHTKCISNWMKLNHYCPSCKYEISLSQVKNHISNFKEN